MDDVVTLTDGDTTLSLDLDAGGRLIAFDVGGHQVLAEVDRESIFHWGSFVMAPWAGRIRDGRFSRNGQEHRLPVDWPPHAIHGTVLDRPWRVEASSQTNASIACDLDDRWPWPGTVRQHVTVLPSGAEFRIEVHAADEPFPAAAGWHPWFRRRLGTGGPVDIELSAGTMLKKDAAGIPTGERIAVSDQPWDDCFDDLHWPVRLTWPGVGGLTIGADTRYAVVYTELADAVCVEPQTGPPDALTLEPVLVTPEQPLAATMTWRWWSLV